MRAGRVCARTGIASSHASPEPFDRESRMMFDTPEQIRNQLRAGEDGRAEFKEVCFGDRAVPSPDTEELAGELVAFANAEGGVVFLGVDDWGAARGIPPERLDSVEHWLLNVANHNCDPPIRRSARSSARQSCRTTKKAMIDFCWRRCRGDCMCTEHRAAVTTRGLGPQSGISRRRSLPGCSSSEAESTCSTSSPCLPPPWTTSTAIDSRRSSDAHRRFPGSTFCAALE